MARAPNIVDLPRAALQRTVPVPAGTVFWYWGRALRVVSVRGDDPAAPVVVEEMGPIGDALAGQYALWSLDGVRRALRGNCQFAQTRKSATVTKIRGRR
jgi:hypothetical protein